LHLCQAEPTPKQPNLNKLGDGGEHKGNAKPTQHKPIFESRAVYLSTADLLTRGVIPIGLLVNFGHRFIKYKRVEDLLPEGVGHKASDAFIILFFILPPKAILPAKRILFFKFKLEYKRVHHPLFYPASEVDIIY
jgi:hypothetical protein